MAKIIRVPLQRDTLQRFTNHFDETGEKLLLEPKKADIVRRNIERRKRVRSVDRGCAISMELRQEGLLPRGYGSQLAGWLK